MYRLAYFWAALTPVGQYENAKNFIILLHHCVELKELFIFVSVSLKLHIVNAKILQNSYCELFEWPQKSPNSIFYSYCVTSISHLPRNSDLTCCLFCLFYTFQKFEWRNSFLCPNGIFNQKFLTRDCRRKFGLIVWPIMWPWDVTAS